MIGIIYSSQTKSDLWEKKWTNDFRKYSNTVILSSLRKDQDFTWFIVFFPNNMFSELELKSRLYYGSVWLIHVGLAALSAGTSD